MIKKITKAVNHPQLALRELNKLYYKSPLGTVLTPDRTHIMEEDWDNLVLIDACRYDLFEERNTIQGDLKPVHSRGSDTIDFLMSNFSGDDYLDTVYITGNPMLYQYHNVINVEFYREVHVWDEDGWDSETGTILPDTMTEYALSAAEEHPNKRLIIHYIQPHYPFIASESEFDKGQLNDDDNHISFWQRMMRGELDLDPEQIWEMYRKNLDRVLNSIESLLLELEGKTIMTSDHGNMIGEPSFPIPIREYGHPTNTYTPELIEVPWLVTNYDNRKDIVVGSKCRNGDRELESESAQKRLEDLGYK